MSLKPIEATEGNTDGVIEITEVQAVPQSGIGSAAGSATTSGMTMTSGNASPGTETAHGIP